MWQPPLSKDETDLVMVWKNQSVVSRSDGNLSYSTLLPMVVPRAQLEAYGGDAYRHALVSNAASMSKMLLEKDAAGNTMRALMLSQQTHTKTLALAPHALPAKRLPPPTPEARMLQRLQKEVEEDRKLTALQLVEKYRPEIEEQGASQMTGAARQTAMIARAARLCKGRKTKATINSARGRYLLEKGFAIPRNTYIPRHQYQNLRAKLKKRHERAKAQAREQGDEITPELVKAKEALRFMSGTRNDVIATGARFGKRAEYMEMRKRQDRSRGKRHGPHGLMHRT